MPNDVIHEAELVSPAPRRPDGTLTARTVGRQKGAKNRIVERTRAELEAVLTEDNNPLIKLLRIYQDPATPLAIQVQAASALARHILPRLTEGSLNVSGSVETRGAILHGIALADPNLRRAMEKAAAQMSSAQFKDSPRFQVIAGSDRLPMPALLPAPAENSQAAEEARQALK